MGLMKKAVAALGFGDGGKGRKASAEAPVVEQPTAAPAGSLSAPQQEFEVPDDFRFALLSTDSASADYSSSSVALWAGRSSADGRLGVLLACQRSIGITLDSPGTSATGTPSGPSCTGGGHGEAPPSVLGNHPRLSTPTLRQSSSNANHMLSHMCTATATPLARQVATRALRKVGDSAPVSLPSITSLTGGVRPTPIQVPGGGAASPDTGPSPPISPPSTSPRPPTLGPSGYNPSPRMRRSTTLDTHIESEACQYVAVSATAAAAGAGIATSPSAISAPCADLPVGAGASSCHLPYGYARERFSRLASFNFHDAHCNGRDEPMSDHGGGGDSSPCGSAKRGPGSPTAMSNSSPISALRMEALQGEDEPSQAAAGTSPSPFCSSVSSAHPAAVVVSPGPQAGGAAAGNRVATPPSSAVPPAERAVAGPSRHGSSSQLSLRAHGFTPYTPHQQPQQQHGRMPPRRVSEYSMAQVQGQQQERMLPKLKSVASAMASVSAANALLSTSCKALDTSSVSATTAASASVHGVSLRAHTPPPTAVAVTAVAESAAASTAAGTADLRGNRPRRCFVNIAEQLPPSGSSGGGGAASSSGTSSRGGSAKASSQGGPVPSGAAAAASASPVVDTESEASLPTKFAAEVHPHAQAPPPQTPSPLSKSAVIQEERSPMPRGTARKLASPTTTLSPLASSAPSPAAAEESAEPTSPRALAGESMAAEPSPRRQSSPKAQQGPTSQVDEFVPRPSPAQGLLHFSPSAPVQMLRSPVSWGVSDYKVVRKLYAGYASSVYKACCLYSGSDVVLKAYNLAGLSTFLRNQVLRELDIHSRLRHPGVVHLMAAFREGDILLLVLEYVRGGSLDRVRRKLGGRMTEFQAMHLVLLPLLGVLTYLHERGIVHRDIKPENLLFTESWQLKLCDYGVSICLREERAVTRTGSREYMAPEVNICPLKKGPEDNKDNLELAYTPAVDIWSLGALMYELLVGFTPFPGGPPTRKEGVRGSAGAALAFPSSVSQGARTFVRSCLELDPVDRPTILELTQHPWIREALEYNASLRNP